jgi:DNA polymerase I
MTRYKRPIFIFDITSILFRMYCTGIEKTSQGGLEVGGVFGVALSMRKLLRIFRPQYIAAVFDAGKATVRNEIDDNYKKNRPPPPDNLRHQFDLVLELIQSMGIQTFQKRGYEADDLMATLTRHARIQEYPVHLITNDKDIHQLIIDSEPHVRQFSLNGKDMYDENAVVKKFGIMPKQMIDFQAMVGDSVDNVSGIDGIGVKTAGALLRHFDTLDNIFDNLENVEHVKVRGAKTLHKKLIQGKESAYKAQKLVQLLDDVDLVDMYPDSITPEKLFDMDELRWKGPKMEGRTFFENMNFSFMYQDFRHLAG